MRRGADPIVMLGGFFLYFGLVPFILTPWMPYNSAFKIVFFGTLMLGLIIFVIERIAEALRK